MNFFLWEKLIYMKKNKEILFKKKKKRERP